MPYEPASLFRAGVRDDLAVSLCCEPKGVAYVLMTFEPAIKDIVSRCLGAFCLGC